MSLRSRIRKAVHPHLLRTVRTPAGRFWARLYWGIARGIGRYLTRGESDAAAYVRGGLARGDFLPGLSDIDLVVVLSEDPAGPGVARERTTRRWQRLGRVFPLSGLLVDTPRIYESGKLRDLVGSTALTYGLDDGRSAHVHYTGGEASFDMLLLRPGLYGPAADWRLLSGPDRRPREPAWDAQLRRIAGWLELVAWWRELFPALLRPTGERTAALCVKVIAEPARIWLWLVHGERCSTRGAVLERTLVLLPEEEDSLRGALDLQDALPDSPVPPLAEVVPALVRFSRRIADVIGAQVAGAGVTEVRLAGVQPAELIHVGGGWQPNPSVSGGTEPRLLPLTDWRSVVAGEHPDDSFVLLPGDPADVDVLRAVVASDDEGPYPAFRAGGLMVLPGRRASRTRLRALQCAATDPVSFALSAGEVIAAFPDVRGWSARDTARRAVAEHRDRLRLRPEEGGRALAALLTAARAALFLESIDRGEPELPLTVSETARQLAARSEAAGEALQSYREFALLRREPPAWTVAEMRKLVLGLPAYAEVEGRGGPHGAAG